MEVPKIRTLLISPPYPILGNEPRFCSPPLGLAYIAAVLERHGWPVRVVDCVVEEYEAVESYGRGVAAYGMRKGDILSLVAEYQADLVGISCLFSTVFPIVEEISRAIKERFPTVKIVLGGAHPTASLEYVVTNEAFDYVVRGEGEMAVLGLVEHLAGQRAIAEVPNLAWAQFGVIQATHQEFVQDLDELPFPARHLLNMEGYMAVGRFQGLTKRKALATTMITSRGCPAKCVFCSIHGIWGRKFRAHSAEYVLGEMRELREKYGVDYLLFEDDNLTLARKRAKQIFQGMVENGFNFSWATPNGVAVWALDKSMLELMKESGCYWLCLAFESGVQDTLDNIIKKPIKLDKALHIVEECKELGLRTTAFFVVGLPGETMKSMKASMAFAERLRVDSVAISVATPYPGTELYEQCVDKGYLTAGFDQNRLMTRIGQIRTPEFGPEDVAKLVSRTFWRRVARHPVGTVLRVLDKFKASPVTTTRSVWKHLKNALLPG